MNNIDEERIFNAMKECGDLAEKLKAEGKSADYILIYSKGYFQGEYDTKQKLKSELETYKKIAEKLAEILIFLPFGEDQKQFFTKEAVIDWARKEVTDTNVGELGKEVEKDEKRSTK